MPRISNILRLIALSILFGGSLSIVFAAITLVKAAEAQGIPVLQAATTNAPVFIQFSKISLGAGFILLLAEGLDYASHRRLNKMLIARYAASLLCTASTMVFALGIVPPMQELSTAMKSNPQAHEEFKKLHEVSRMVFGTTILLALISLLIPAFESSQPTATIRD